MRGQAASRFHGQAARCNWRSRKRAPPAGCSYAVNPTAVTIPIGGSSGTSTVSVTGTNNCSWSAQSNQFWIRVTGGNGGTSSGTIAYTADPNSGLPRFGWIVVTHTQGTTDISFS